jgi:hypothetical protein
MAEFRFDWDTEDALVARRAYALYRDLQFDRYNILAQGGVPDSYVVGGRNHGIPYTDAMRKREMELCWAREDARRTYV